MHKFGDVLKPRRNSALSLLRLASIAVLILFVFAIATQSHIHLRNQNAAAAGTKFEYEVASIKLDESDHSSSSINNPLDGFTATNTSLKNLIQNAYGVLSYQIVGGPDWLNSERYVIEAKMDATTADALQKLSPDDRNLARQQMLRALLVDRLKLTIHRETRELPVYFLVIAKNGPKIHEAKPDDTYADGLKGRGGVPAGPGLMTTSSNWLSQSTTAQAMPISNLASFLAGSLRRPVLDKTGLVGKYDFKLKFSVDRAEPQGDSGESLNGQPRSATLDPDAPFLFTAVQQQLGLKLESGKGPVEVIVIDHVERPSGN
jgi:uncharacterized protein (TIGR03435 family)